jgi:putative tryptophan/tyrosine transport system substrate-binding protein
MALLGTAAALSPAAQAQQPMPVIGYLSNGSLESDLIAARLTAFRQGLNEMGYVEGQSVVIEYRWAQSQYDRLPGLAADLVRRQVAVIAAIGGAPQAVAAKAATATIPIVFTVGPDPVQLGLVASLNRPGGNITGVTSLTAELEAKRLDLVRQLLPTVAVVALLVNPTNPATTEAETRSLRDAARSRGLQMHLLEASNESEIDAAFRTLVEFRAGALVVGADTFFETRRDQIVALAARDAVPVIYAWRLFAEAGGLMSYGTDLADTMRQAGVLAGKILKGAKPADLPVQQVVKVGLVINLKTAETLGLTVPLTLSGRADEVIE